MPLCFGAMMLGAWGTTDHGESVRILDRALDAGIDFIDFRRRRQQRRT